MPRKKESIGTSKKNIKYKDDDSGNDEKTEPDAVEDDRYDTSDSFIDDTFIYPWDDEDFEVNWVYEKEESDDNNDYLLNDEEMNDEEGDDDVNYEADEEGEEDYDDLMEDAATITPSLRPYFPDADKVKKKEVDVKEEEEEDEQGITDDSSASRNS